MFQESTIRNAYIEADRQFLTMQCPPHGSLRFNLDDGEALGEDWNPVKVSCMNWIQDNWEGLWPVVEGQLNNMVTNYAYGEKSLRPHLTNPRNSLIIRPIDQTQWAISLEIQLEHGGHAFCIDLDGDTVIDYQAVY